MKKIPTIFERDWNGNRSLVTSTPSKAHALLDGAIATVKFDGTSCLIRGGKLFKRYDCKQGRTAPPDFEPCGEPDPETGHQPGWIPVLDRPEDKYHRKAFQGDEPDGTYELCGPKVQGNPEGLAELTLIPHGKMEMPHMPTDFEGIKAFLENLKIEGIVWWKNGEPVAKIKRRDFGFKWPVK